MGRLFVSRIGFGRIQKSCRGLKLIDERIFYLLEKNETMTSTHTTTERRYVDGRTLDEKDNIIHDILEHNGRATLAQLAEAASLSISATQSRVQKLEKNGVIVGYRAIIHYPEQTTGTIHAFVSVTPLEYDENANIPEKLEHISGIDSCDAVSGSQVYVLTVTVPTVPQLEDLVTKIHRIVPSNVETTMVLHRYFPR